MKSRNLMRANYKKCAKMKRIDSYILALLTLLLASCMQDAGVECPQEQDGKTYTAQLSVAVPTWTEETRAGVSSGDIGIAAGSMQLLCFDQNGYYLGMGTQTTIKPNGSYKGSMTAKVPTGTCRIHFIANANLTDNAAWLGMYENTLIASLTADVGDNMVYWGYKKCDDSATMQAFLEGNNTVYLIRNQAKVTVNNTSGEISKVQLAVANDYDKGTLAPFDATNLASPFSYDQADGAAVVTVPASAAVRTAPTDVNADAEQYLFETNNTQALPVKVILKVTYTDGSVCYHQIMLIDDKYSLYKIRRNHNYQINIKRLDKSLGYSTFAKALDGSPSNNQYISVDEIVPSVSDADSRTLTVKVPTASSTSEYEEGTVMICQTVGTQTVKFTYTGDAAMTADDFTVAWAENNISQDSQLTLAYSNGEGTITFPVNSVSSAWQQGKITLQDTKHGLMRNIKVYVVKSLDLNATVSSFGTTKGSKGKISFTIPDAFPSELLPVEVKIATNALNTSSGDPLGVVVESTSDIGQSWNFWYLYTATTTGTHTINMVTVRTNNKNTSDTVYLKADYFTTTGLTISYN